MLAADDDNGDDKSDDVVLVWPLKLTMGMTILMIRPFLAADDDAGDDKTDLTMAMAPVIEN